MAPYIAVFILSWIVFWIAADRTRLLELFIYGVFGALISFIVISIESVFDWWEFIRQDEGQEIAIQLMLSLSLYAVESMLLIQILSKPRSGWLRWAIWTAAFTLLNTGAEAVLIKLGLIRYMRGWNFGWTLVSYLVPFTVVFLFSLPYRSHFNRTRDG